MRAATKGEMRGVLPLEGEPPSGTESSNDSPLGATFIVRGEFALSRVHLGEVNRLCIRDTQLALLQEVGVHPHTMALTFLASSTFVSAIPIRLSPTKPPPPPGRR